MLALVVLAMIAASACAHGSAADSWRSVNCPTKVPGKAGEDASGTPDESSTDIAVELNGRDITIDGTLIDVLPIAGNLYALPKLVRFLDQRWGDRSPVEHPGSLVLKISSSASVAQVHAVVTTAVFAGYPNIEVQTGQCGVLGCADTPNSSGSVRTCWVIRRSRGTAPAKRRQVMGAWPAGQELTQPEMANRADVNDATATCAAWRFAPIGPPTRR